MKNKIVLILFSLFLISTAPVFGENHPYDPDHASQRNGPHTEFGHPSQRDYAYDTRTPREPTRFSDQQYYHTPPPEKENVVDTATKMLLDQGILGLAVLGMGWLVFRLFNKLDGQREESEKVLTGIVEKNYDMLNKLEGRLAELSARLQNIEREVERIRS
tara:strand:+ start:2170 stop:2649 length:480 start_codon:yes stop_codon:yes gene_type:complete